MAGLDLTAVAAAHSHSNGTTEQTLFTITSTNNNVFRGCWIDTVNLTANTTFKVSYKIDGSNFALLETVYWSTGMSDALFIAGNTPINSDFKITATSSSVEGATRSIPYEYWTEGIGAGAVTFTYTLTDAVTSAVIQSALIWITSDASGNNRVFEDYTNSSGQITAYLTADTYYFWRQKDGYTFSNPDVEIVA
jgi:hypothetical protein|tara:strand:+ start:867 stop:1445 length:579 start_codon:yes stop_codon:yes gene_type:complete